MAKRYSKTFELRLFFIVCLSVIIGTICFIQWTSYQNLYLHSFALQQKLIPVREHAITNATKRKGLIIVTHYRSGSTFLGQYFNQRNDSFYVFEPLYPFGHECPRGVNESVQVEHLHDLFHCKFQNQTEIFKKTGAFVHKKRGDGTARSCLRHNFCFRSKTKALCTEEFCRSGDASACYDCEAVNLTMASHKCLSADIIVIKVIRICNIANLKSLLEDVDLDLKILELARDPRGLYGSRKKMGITSTGSVKSTCNEVIMNWDVAVKQKNGWMKNKFKLVRYSK